MEPIKIKYPVETCMLMFRASTTIQPANVNKHVLNAALCQYGSHWLNALVSLFVPSRVSIVSLIRTLYLHSTKGTWLIKTGDSQIQGTKGMVSLLQILLTQLLLFFFLFWSLYSEDHTLKKYSRVFSVHCLYMPLFKCYNQTTYSGNWLLFKYGISFCEIFRDQIDLSREFTVLYNLRYHTTTSGDSNILSWATI